MKKRAPQPRIPKDPLTMRRTPPKEPFPRYTGELDWRERQKNFMNYRHVHTKD